MAVRREFVQSNLEKLAECTTVSTGLLSHLHINNVLTQWDMWDLEAIAHRGAKAQKLYTIVLGKNDDEALNQLKIALELSSQSGALQLLMSAESQRNSSNEVQDQMPLWQKEHIRKNLDKLVQCTAITRMLTLRLEDNDVLSRWDVDDIESVPSRLEKASKLYMLIQKKGAKAYDALMEAFKSELQMGAFEILRAAKPTDIEEAEQNQNQNRPDGNGMEAWQREFIRANLDKLVQNTNLSTPLVTALYAQGIISRNDLDTLDAEPHRGKKNILFYDIVQTKGNGAFEKLIEAFGNARMTGVQHILRQAQP